jgi:AraC-like DNA-binding protein
MRRRLDAASPALSVSLGRSVRDWQLTNLGHIPRKGEWIERSFGNFAVGLVVSGAGTYQVDDGPIQRVGPGCAFTVYPGPLFRYGPTHGTTWNEYHIGGVGPAVRRWIERGWFWQTGRVEALSQPERLVALMRDALKLHARNRVGDEDRVFLVAERLMCEMHYARASRTTERSQHAAVVDALDYVLAHAHEAIDWQRLAARFGMSYSALRQQVRRLTGRPPQQYLLHLRAEAVKQRLLETDESVKSLARRFGAPDPYTFSRSFKKVVGLSPSAYRRELREWQRTSGPSR